MDKMDRFWINFGKSIAWGILFAILIASIELIAPVDVGRFPWAKTFGFTDFIFLLGVGTFIFGLAGIAIGFIDRQCIETGIVRR